MAESQASTQSQSTGCQTHSQVIGRCMGGSSPVKNHVPSSTDARTRWSHCIPRRSRVEPGYPNRERNRDSLGNDGTRTRGTGVHERFQGSCTAHPTVGHRQAAIVGGSGPRTGTLCSRYLIAPGSTPSCPTRSVRPICRSGVSRLSTRIWLIWLFQPIRLPEFDCSGGVAMEATYSGYRDINSKYQTIEFDRWR